MLHSFSFDYVIRQKVKTVTKLLLKAYEEREKKMAWELYLSVFPKMNEDNYVSFDDFWDRLRIPKKPKKTNEEIKIEIEKVKQIHQSRGGDALGTV